MCSGEHLVEGVQRVEEAGGVAKEAGSVRRGSR